MTRSKFRAIVAFFIVTFASLAIGLWLRVNEAPEWMAPDPTQNPPAMRPWAVEADCYSQLARDQRILRGQGLIQSHFAVENWPEGLIPSTTAPFDYVILLLYAPLMLVTAHHPLDWAGALVSPALWIALGMFWVLFRSREFTLTGRALLLAGSAALPAFVWATACGRPRHQSLILALMAVGLTAEYERWHIELTPKRAWNILAGTIWGLACWTSLFEPAFVVTVLILFNLVMRRRENPAFLISFGTVMLIALLLEGVHIFLPPPEFHAPLERWLITIREVQPVAFVELVQRMTIVLLALPVIAWFLWPRAGGNKTDALVIILTALLILFASLQGRWIYSATLGELFLIVRFCQVTPAQGGRVLVLMLALFGILYSNAAQGGARSSNQPSPELAQISRSIDQPGGIMAPWWLSPGLLYFSGNPIVSGSSHCGISGIVASAKFFAATSWPEAEQILRDHQVRWVVVWDDPRYVYPLLDSSRGILGIAPATDENPGDAESTIAQQLIADQSLPAAIRLRSVTPQMKLYEFVPQSTGS